MIWLGAVAQAASAYDEIVAPIFRARCVSCHGEEKAKGKLALHTWERTAKGGDSGPLWIAGNPNESELVRRLRLPADDEEHMPPRDEPQPAAEEIALLMRWIERSASATVTVAELGLSAQLAKAVAELPQKLAAVESSASHAEPLWEFDAAAVAQLRAPHAEKFAALQRRFPGALSYESRTSAAVHFTTAGLGRDFGDADLAALAAVREAVVSLDLAGTAITDRSARVLESFKQVRVLRLAFTAVGDVTVAALAGLPKLEVLTLHETATTAASVPVLAKISSLRRLHLGGTPAAQMATDAGLPVVDAGVDALTPVSTEAAVAPASRG